MRRSSILVLILVVPFLFTGCVTSGKYHDMEALRDEASLNYDSLAMLTTRQISDLRQRNDSLQRSLTALNETYNQTRSKTSEQIRELFDSLQQSQGKLSASDVKLRDLNQRLAARDSALNAVKTKLNDALLPFKETGLSINIKNGKVYVSLSNQLLFSTGRTGIDRQGKDALDQLAEVLIQQPDLGILVEGHTDNARVIDLGAIKDNWDLSVMRATEVVRYLLKGDRISPNRITASGRSEYDPVEEGTSAEARAKNRRTEIILTPRLGELFDMLGGVK